MASKRNKTRRKSYRKWSVARPSIISEKSPFWFQSTWPQYRKVVNGEEKCLDGTETPETEIVKYDHSDAYKKWRDFVLNSPENDAAMRE
jgi:hypothetical protein